MSVWIGMKCTTWNLENVPYWEAGGKYPDGGLRLHECKNPGIGYGGHGLCGKQYRPTLFRRQGAFLPADAFSPGSYERPALFAEAGHGFFHRVFVPAASVNREGRALLIEFALYVFAFLGRQSEYSQMSVSALRIFERLHYALGIGNVYSLSRGSQFDFEGVAYDVLWPAAGGYPFSPLLTEIVEELDVCLSSPFLGRGAPEFLALKNEFCGEYLRLCQLTSPPEPGVSGGYGGISFPRKRLLDKIEAMAPSLQLIPAAQNIIEILSRRPCGRNTPTLKIRPALCFKSQNPGGQPG